MKTFLKWLLGILIVVGLILLAGFFIVSSLLSNEPSVPAHAYLSMELSGTLSEFIPGDPVEEAFGQAQMDMKKIRDNLEKAAVDERIHGVLLRIGMLETGYAKIQELRHVIRQFKKSGKPIYALLGPDVAMTKDYYVASGCDSVFMPPTANLFLTGVRSEVTFYKDLMDKFGIQAQFIQIGKYKNAPDVYTHSGMSAPHREVLQDIINQLYEDVVQTVAASRGLAEQEVRRLINEQTGFTGREAVDAGLVDRLTYDTEIKKSFPYPAQRLKSLSGYDYARVPASSLKIRNKRRLAVINCVGVIASGSDTYSPVFGRVMGSATVTNNIERAARSKSIKAIILRVDSPGGSATASDAIWQAVKEAAKKKPVVASVSDYGASGGYYISMAADTMLAAPNSLVGSIGVFAGKFSLNGLYKKLGLNSQAVQKGRNADLFSMLRPWSTEERSVMRRLIGKFYHDFVQKAADSRHLTFKEADRLARGRVWTGRQAADNHLFDGQGYFYSAVEAAKKMAGIDSSESVRLVYYPRRRSWLNEIFNAIEVRMSSVQMIFVQKLTPFIRRMQNRPLALMPFHVEFK